MATAKKPTTRDSKSKATPEKPKLKPVVTPPKKTAGIPRKSASPSKKDISRANFVPAETVPSVAGQAAPESVAQKPRGKAVAKKTGAPPPYGVAAAATTEPATDAPRPIAKEPGPDSPQVEIALRALREGKAIELIFRDADGNPPRTFEPRQLIFDTLAQAWFVWGWDRRYNAERHHRLDQLAEINLVDGPGRSAQGPYKEGTPANLIGGWLGGEPIPVKATLQKQWIFAVKQSPPAFPEFKIEDAEDGKATVSFVATDLRAIARWCLQFGEGIQVLEPQRLVDRVKQVGVAWAGKPVAAAPAPKPLPPPAPRTDYKPEHKPEHRREHGKDREEAPKKGQRVEIRVEKL